MPDRRFCDACEVASTEKACWICGKPTLIYKPSTWSKAVTSPATYEQVPEGLFRTDMRRPA